MANEDGFYIKEWEDFVENFAKFVDSWEADKEKLLNELALVYQREVMLTLEEGKHDDTSTLKHSFKIYVFGKQDYADVGTNIKYALYLNDGHVQHKRFLPAERLSTGGRTKYLKGDNQKGIMLSERYVPGVYFLEEAQKRSEPQWKKRVENFMEYCARKIEVGKS